MSGLVGEPRTGEVSIGSVRRKPGALSGLGPRVASALVLMVVALGATLSGGRAFDLFWLVAGCAVLWEWQTLIGGARRSTRVAIGWVGLAAVALLVADRMPGAAALALGAGLVALAASAEPGKRGLSAAGLLYAGALVMAVTILRQSALFGLESILWLFAVVWGTDCMAFFGGRLIGGPKLYPKYSPSKTWSGFLVGVVCGSLLGLLVSTDPEAVAGKLVLGLACGCVAQAGDLFESALKRRFGAKDSSSLIPGHGGVMDRLDGFIASSVVVACLGIWRFGVDAAALGLFHW